MSWLASSPSMSRHSMSPSMTSPLQEGKPVWLLNCTLLIGSTSNPRSCNGSTAHCSVRSTADRE